MCTPFQEPQSTATAEEIRELAERTCTKVREMAEAVIAMAFEGKTASDFGEARGSAHSPRIGMEFALDDLRGAADEALTERYRTQGYANTETLAKSWTDCLDRNAAARRAAARSVAARPALVSADRQVA